jgi:hypothetical protein
VSSHESIRGDPSKIRTVQLCSNQIGVRQRRAAQVNRREVQPHTHRCLPSLPKAHEAHARRRVKRYPSLPPSALLSSIGNSTPSVMAHRARRLEAGRTHINCYRQRACRWPRRGYGGPPAAPGQLAIPATREPARRNGIDADVRLGTVKGSMPSSGQSLRVC